jgi:hypothetical protein
MPDQDINVVVLPWSAADYVMHLPARPNGFASIVEERMESMFPPLFARPFPTIDTPCTIIDNEDNILCWYLPGCLTLTRQASSA